MAEEIVNRVANSKLINLDPADFYPKEDIQVIDIKPWLFQGLILKEKDFREAVKTHDWQQYENKLAAVYCSSDAIIPQWAYMLISSELRKVTADFYFGTENEVREQAFLKNLHDLDTEQYRDERIIIKGCGDIPISDAAYLELTKKLVPVAKSLLFGEACSTVPVYKKKK